MSCKNYSQLQAETSVTTTTINPLEEKLDKLKADYEDLTEKNIKYNNLIDNLNILLSNTYYGYASNGNWIIDGFTAFNLKYNNNYYLITAGHCVENENGKFSNFKFKANFSDEWIYPELLTYKYEYDDDKPTLNVDYAIFYSDYINNGFTPEINRTYPEFVLGNGKFNIIRNAGIAIPGESGSPIINLDGKVIGMVSAPFTDIDIILQAIDNIN